MNVKEAREAYAYLTPKEQAELDELIAQDMRESLWVPLAGPQSQAHESEADITGYGGAAGGGKTDLIAGLAITKHTRSLIVRREKAQTEGVIQRMTEILGTTDGFNSTKAVWRIDNGLVEFAGLDNPGDEKRWQGRPHDLIAIDEVTETRENQARFILGWNRTNLPGQRCRVVMTFNPPTTNEGRWVVSFFGPWIDRRHPLYPTPFGQLRWATTIKGEDVWVEDATPFVLGPANERIYDFDAEDYEPEQIIVPKSRTFIPARLTDNVYYMASGYMSTLQALPEPLRSQMLLGDFEAGMGEDPWQVVPTAWVEAAQARWVKKEPRGEMLNMGVDVARGGRDKTVIVTRHEDGAKGMWFDKPSTFPGTETPDGPTVAGLVVSRIRDESPIHLDVIGVGASPYDTLNGMGFAIYGVNVAEKATAKDKSGRLSFFNLRSQLWWQFREAVDPANETGIALPPGKDILNELCTPRWSMQGLTIKVESRDEIIKRLDRSPDMASAFILALMNMPKRRMVDNRALMDSTDSYDPMSIFR